MKGKDTRGYPHEPRYPPAAGGNWLRVDCDEGGKPESDWDQLKLSPHKTRGQGWTRVTEVGGAVDNR